MSIEQASPLVPIKPQVALQNGAFIKNSHNRSSFCGVVPSPTNGNGTLKTFAVNRKSWSGNGTLSLQHYAEPPATTPELATFKTNTGTFPRHRERNNNADHNEANGILTPNGNSTQTFGGNEVRRSAGTGSANGRRYAEIGNWSKRSSTFLEPHLQGVGERAAGADGDGSSESDSAGGGRGATGADEARALLRRSPRQPRARRARRNDNSPPYRSERVDNAPGELDSPDAPAPAPALNPREFFERLQSARAEPARRALAAGPPSPRDSLSQSRESLSSDGEGARGDCSSVGTSGSGSEPQVPCDIGLLERLIRTHPVWFLPGIQRAGAFHLLQGKEEGNFVVRQSSQADTMAVSVRLPQDKGPYIEHYLIQAGGGRIGLETSQNKFDNIPELIAHYAQCCDELPVQLALPRALRDAKSRHQLSSLALLGQEFWGYPMAAPRAHAHLPPSPGAPAATTAAAAEPTPMALTPSDASSLASFSAGISNNQRVLSPEADPNLRPSPMESGSPPGSSQGLSTFKGRPAPSPPAHKNGTFVRAPRPTPPNTLNLISTTAHITQQFPSPTQPGNPKITPPPPPPRWAKPPFPKSALSPSPELGFSPVSNPPMSNGNITVTTTVTFSVNNTQIHNHQINENVHNDRLQLTLASNPMHNNNMETIFNGNELQNNSDLTQNMVNRRSPDGECISSITATLHGSFKRQFTEQHAADPCSPQDTNTDPANTYTKSTSFAPNQIVSPNGSNSVTSGIFSPTSQINSPNETVSSKSGVFSPLSQITNKSELFSPVSRSSPLSGKNVFSPISNQSFQNNSVGSPLMGKDRDKLVSPNTNTASSTPSGRSRKSKHSMRKESRHYQESDILESPGVYCRSSLLDKVSDYEDIWGPESPIGCTTFKPDSAGNKQGIMMSKRPDLLPDTLPKLNAAQSTNSILEKENLILMASNDSLNKKQLLDQDTIMKSNFNHSNELIATTNSKGEVVPKRPDKLNILRSANKQLTEELEAANKENNDLMEISKSNDDLNGTERILGEPEKDKAGSPFYADPVDAIKEAAVPLVQRRKLLRVGTSLAQRYSEPPTNHPYYPLRDMHSIEELSPSSANTSSSVDNLAGLRTGRPKMKPVQPPRVAGKPPPAARHDPTWAVDSSWEFISAQEEGGSESGTFPSLAEQECRLSGVDGSRLTVHQVVAQRMPELRLNGAPVALPEERCPPRASRYDNVLDHRPVSEQASDDGTVFSEPWDCAQWDGLLPPGSNHLSFDGEEEREWESPLSGRKSLAAVARAKSFRDRLDPLLAAGRLRALRGGRGARGAGAGAALRAYALHLAQDKSTTFAQNVDNFIACTLDSKEICPQVVMRNMRQFMSGMKNYLVKHGEREFEKEVEKERMKLKSTEFLNLDAILETVMHRLVVRPLRARLYALLADWHASDVRALHAAIDHAADTTPLQMGIKATTNIPSSAVLAVISRHFVKMQEADSPLDKLENLLAAISAIFNSIRGERALGADDLLPMLAWVVARCRLVCAELEAELMAGLLPPALLAGEGGYYLTALFSAVAVLKKLAPAQHEPAASWRRSSLESGSGSGSGQACVVRVALPDECRGSIRRVALPCRAGARARDLCRALAHQAAITNPQDYALFALHNGQETMLSENDCPQEAMSEKNGKDCILAYKRIDAKIAWPQHALLSLP